MFDVANDGSDLQPFELSVYSVKASDQMFQKKFKGLRQTQHGLAINHKGCDFFTTILDNFTLVCRGVVGGDRRRRRVIAKASVHELVHEVQVGGAWGAAGMATGKARM